MPDAKESIHLETWPKVITTYDNEQVLKEMKEVMEAIVFVRNYRNTENISNKIKFPILVEIKTELGKKVILENQDLLMKFMNAESIVISTEVNEKSATRMITENAIYHIIYQKEIDIPKEIAKYEEELKHLNQEVNRCQSMLSNERFLQKAPESKIKEEKEKLQNYLSRKESVEKHLTDLNKLK